MSSLLKLRRGSTVAHETFTGAEGEVTFNTDTNALVTHDGATVGGFPHVKAADLAANSGSLLVGYLPAGTGAVATTVQSKLREIKSLADFGWSSSLSTADQFSKVQAAWDSAIANDHDLLHPGGICNVGVNSLPFGRINGLIPTSLLDCKNVTIYGIGPTSTFKTSSITGADVFQLNGAKNLHLRNFKIVATISGSASGSNGISVTGGYDNITIDQVWMEDLPSVDQTTYIDGGKALTIQTPISGQTVECGTLKATRVYAKGCAYGFGLELDLVAASTMATSIDIDIVAEDCHNAVIVSAGGATSAISANWTMGLRVRAQAINCMQDVNISRGHGVIVDAQVVTTKTQAERILNYAGVKWLASDTTADVISLYVAYAHASHIRVIGNKGDCSYKAIVGGATAGSSGLTGATWLSKIETDLLGTASAAEFGAINSGGDVTSNCTLIVRNAAASPADAHYLPSRNNAIIYGSGYVLDQLLVRNKISFTDTDGLVTFGAEVGYDDAAVTVKQKNSSSGSAEIFKILNNTGSVVFSFRNDGMILSAGRATASAVSTVKQVMPVYDTANALVGYVPIYTSFTP